MKIAETHPAAPAGSHDADPPTPPPRKKRADGQRNRDRLLEAAKAAFAGQGADVGLDEIARRAGVGIGTLYRHFPTRAAIVEAVYRREVEQLASAATRLQATHAPADALHEWMRLFVDYIATKKIVAPALGPSLAKDTPLYAATGARIAGAMVALVRNGQAAGAVRADANPEDLLRALIGITYGNTSPGWEPSARRLIDILMDGLRIQP